MKYLNIDDNKRQRRGADRRPLHAPSEDVGHEEVHERPQLHQAVLQRGPREEETPLGVERQQRLPPLALEVLDVLSFVQDQVIPLSLGLTDAGEVQQQQQQTNKVQALAANMRTTCNKAKVLRHYYEDDRNKRRVSWVRSNPPPQKGGGTTEGRKGNHRVLVILHIAPPLPRLSKGRGRKQHPPGGRQYNNNNNNNNEQHATSSKQQATSTCTTTTTPKQQRTTKPQTKQETLNP